MLIVSGLEIKRTEFPNGESHFDIEGLKERVTGSRTGVKITLKYENDSDIFGLIGLVEQIREYNKEIKIVLNIPYLPYSRMDRGNDTKMTTLKTLAGVLNSLNLERVITEEVHSDVSKDLINNLRVRDTTKEIYNKYILSKYTGDAKKGVYVVYPDAGASKRYKEQIENKNVIEIEKKRNFETGKLEGMEIITPREDYKDCKTAIILDDLCSKGGTFAWATDLLVAEGTEEIVLIVTHIEKTILEGSMYKHKNIKKVIGMDTMLTPEEVSMVEYETGGKVEIIRREW